MINPSVFFDEIHRTALAVNIKTALLGKPLDLGDIYFDDGSLNPSEIIYKLGDLIYSSPFGKDKILGDYGICLALSFYGWRPATLNADVDSLQFRREFDKGYKMLVKFLKGKKIKFDALVLAKMLLLAVAFKRLYYDEYTFVLDELSMETNDKNELRLKVSVLEPLP